MEKPVRKRGRPPITKDYKNPLESPMAHSSLKVQKLGAQSFSRPMMKVGQFTPSPRNRRTSSSSSCSNSAGNLGSGSNPDDLSSSAPCSTKGRFRGVLLTTPTKRHTGVSSSSTPSSNDSMFHSSSRMTLRSSPPMSSSPLSVAIEGKMGSHCDTAQLFKFALTIGENGRATIAGSSPLSTPAKEVPRASNNEISEKTNLDNTSNVTNQNTYEKKRVLSLLRQMRNGTSNSRAPKKTLNSSNGRPTIVKPSHDVFREVNSHKEQSSHLRVPRGVDSVTNQLSPSVYIPKSPTFPSTPRTSFPIRTGLTPNIGIDQVLLDIVSSPRAGILAGNDNHVITLSPRGRSLVKCTSSSGTAQQSQQESQQESQQQQQQQQFVFKFSSADPLLMTDDIEGNWSEAIYNHLQSSPRHQICFNTPPSWVNLGSPRAHTPQRRNSNAILISACQSSGAQVHSEYRPEMSQPYINIANLRSGISSSPQRNIPIEKGANVVAEPSTPGGQQFSLPAMIECTPLIQQTMNGSLNPKCISGLMSGGTMNEATEGISKPMTAAPEQEDAVVALKKLIVER